MYFSENLENKLNTEYFIAKKLLRGQNEGKKVSRPIVRISILSIILAMAVNIVTLAVVTGFQNEVKDKVIGFGSHLHILQANGLTTYESDPILQEQDFLPKLDTLSFVKTIQPFAYKPALIQSSPDTVYYKVNKKDTFQIQQEIQGVILKGVNKDYDWSFFKKHLKSGHIPDYSDTVESDEIMISRKIANDLHFEVGDKVRAFFVKASPVRRVFYVAGIFETGLEEFDKEQVIADMRHVQKLNDWGIESKIRVADTLDENGLLIIKADVVGGNGNFRYNFGKSFDRYSGFRIFNIKDSTYRLIASDYWMYYDGREPDNAIPDTAYLEVKVTKEIGFPYTVPTNEEGEIIREYLDEDGMHWAINFKNGGRAEFKYIDGVGSHEYYVGGFEVTTNNWDNLDVLAKEVKQVVYTRDIETANDFQVKSIKEDQENIFQWLGFLDLNVYIIIILMIVIGIINMGSAILVMILVRSSFIGLVKALGSTSWSIQKIFLYQSAFLIARGMLWGNILGIGICLLQEHFTIIPLNPEIYYLNAVPIELNIWHIVLLNVGTLLVCLLAMILPSLVISKITPIKSLKFN